MDHINKAPAWLGHIGKLFYHRIRKLHPHIQDRDSLAMLADYYETWRSTQNEINEHLKQEGSFLLNGNLHPVLRVQKDAHAAYERLSKRLGLWGTTDDTDDAELELDLEDEEDD